MSENTTVARPYAKAVFEFALAAGKLPQWSGILCVLAEAVRLPEVREFLENPSGTAEQYVDLLNTVVSQAGIENSEYVQNFLRVLASQKRMIYVPEIFELYEELRAEQERRLEVKVRTSSELSQPQREKLVESLSQRLQCRISLNEEIDTSLLGGALIQAGDLVFDGSVRKQLEKLRAALSV